jgi:hypothetical protein
MARGTVVLDIYEHGDRADALLAAVRETLGLWERLVPNEGPDRVIVAVPDVEQAWAAIEAALDAAGDQGRLIVRLQYPPDHTETPAAPGGRRAPSTANRRSVRK